MKIIYQVTLNLNKGYTPSYKNRFNMWRAEKTYNMIMILKIHGNEKYVYLKLILSIFKVIMTKKKFNMLFTFTYHDIGLILRKIPKTNTKDLLLN